MTGLTTEVKSISEALTKLHYACVETHGRPPKKFIMGIEEFCRLIRETKNKHAHTFLDVEVLISDKPGIGVILH